MASREVKMEDDEGDEEIDEFSYTTQKDAVLFAIDVSASMLERPPPSTSRKADQDSAVSAALRCAYQIMQQRIIAQPKDLMGLLFFGTARSKFRAADSAGGGSGGSGGGGVKAEPEDESGIRHGPGYPHCYLFMDLDVPAAEDVRALKSLAEEGEDPDGVLTPADASAADGSGGGGVSMANVLFCANQIFTTSAPNFGSRRLFLITDNDDPHAGDKAARAAAAVRAKDLYDLGVGIELFPISRDGKAFDLAKFYDDIIYRDPAAEEAAAAAADRVVAARSGDGLTLLASLVSHVRAKQTPKRAYFANLPFGVAPGLDISVKGYLLLQRQKPARTCYVCLDGEKPQLVASETTRVDADTARTVDAGETKKAYKLGGEFVYFAPDELQALRQWPFPDPAWKGRGLRIVGFKPRVLLPPWAAVRRATFLYPSEEDYVGSTRVFAALWRALRRGGKFAVAWYVPRTNANPLLVALLPSDGPGDGDGDGDGDGGDSSGSPLPFPAGLWVHPLPFAEDIRRVDDSRLPPPPRSEALTAGMKPIVENLLLPKTAYNPAKYPNPSLQWHYRMLQALALEEEVPDDAAALAADPTLPKYRAIDKRVGGSLAELKARLQQEAGHLEATRAVKRDVDDADVDADVGAPLTKRPKTASATKAAASAAAPPPMTAQELRQAVDRNTLKNRSVAVLRAILAAHALPTSGNKAALLERIEQWVEEQA